MRAPRVILNCITQSPGTRAPASMKENLGPATRLFIVGKRAWRAGTTRDVNARPAFGIRSPRSRSLRFAWVFIGRYFFFANRCKMQRDLNFRAGTNCWNCSWLNCAVYCEAYFKFKFWKSKLRCGNERSNRGWKLISLLHSKLINFTISPRWRSEHRLWKLNLYPWIAREKKKNDREWLTITTYRFYCLFNCSNNICSYESEVYLVAAVHRHLYIVKFDFLGGSIGCLITDNSISAQMQRMN